PYIDRAWVVSAFAAVVAQHSAAAAKSVRRGERFSISLPCSTRYQYQGYRVSVPRVGQIYPTRRGDGNRGTSAGSHSAATAAPGPVHAWRHGNPPAYRRPAPVRPAHRPRGP